MPGLTLQDRLDQCGGNPVNLLSTPAPPFSAHFFPMPPSFTNWRDEQKAWRTSATLFEQPHMSDLFIRGPDLLRFLSDHAVNSFANFGPGKAKQYMAVNGDGHVIGDGILFGLSDDEASIASPETLPNWLQYRARAGGYDVELRHELAKFAPGATKRFYRYMIEGPNALRILDQAQGRAVERSGFFKMSHISIAGRDVRALNHTMGGVPGDETAGLELFGPAEDEQAVLDALLRAGEDHGMLRGGTISYLSTIAESGWVPNPMPAVFAENLRPYRESVGAHLAFFSPIIGSFRSDHIEDYYVTPWDLGYGRTVKFDHDFLGRAALERMAGQPARKKAWLLWNREDTARLIASAELDGDDRAKPLLTPINAFTYDQILAGDSRVGLAYFHGYTVNIGHWVSVGSLDANIPEGTDVELLWGEPDGGASNPFLPPHRQVRIRATVSYRSPMA